MVKHKYLQDEILKGIETTTGLVLGESRHTLRLNTPGGSGVVSLGGAISRDPEWHHDVYTIGFFRKQALGLDHPL